MKSCAKSIGDMNGESQKIFVKSLWQMQGKSLCMVLPIITRQVSLQVVNWIKFSCYFTMFSSHGKQKKMTWKVLNNFNRKTISFCNLSCDLKCHLQLFWFIMLHQLKRTCSKIAIASIKILWTMLGITITSIKIFWMMLKITIVCIEIFCIYNATITLT